MLNKFEKLSLNNDRKESPEKIWNLKNPTIQKILKDAYILEGDETTIKTLSKSLDYHYQDLSIPYGHIKLLESNVQKISTKINFWYALKGMGTMMQKIETFAITKAKIIANPGLENKLGNIWEIINRMRLLIIESAGDRASGEKHVTAAMLELALRIVPETEIIEMCKKVLTLAKKFWQNEIFKEYLDVKNYILKTNLLCTISQDWVENLDDISEILVYNNVTNEFKNIILSKDNVFELKNGKFSETTWAKIYYANGHLLGQAKKEIFLINYNSKTPEKRSTQKTKNNFYECDF
jgi:hypothetical protein